MACEECLELLEWGGVCRPVSVLSSPGSRLWQLKAQTDLASIPERHCEEDLEGKFCNS